MPAEHRNCLTLALGCCLLACSHQRFDLSGSSNPFDNPAGAGALQSPLPPPPELDPGAESGLIQTLDLGRLGTLIKPPNPPPAISGGTLGVTPDGSVAVVADPDRDAVYLVEPATQRVRTVMLPIGSEPGRVVLDDQRRAHIALRSGNALARVAIDTAGLELVREICQLPRGLAYAPASLWVACADGELVQLAPDSYAERSRRFVARDLRDVFVSNRGVPFVSLYRAASLLAVEPAGSIVASDIPAQSILLGSELFSSLSLGSAAVAWRTIQAPDGVAWMLHQLDQDRPISISGVGYGAGCDAIVRPALTLFDADAKPAATLRLPSSLGIAVDLALSANGQWLAFADPSAYLAEKPTLQLLSTPRFLADSERQGLATSLCENAPTAIELVSDGQATSVAFDRAGLLYVFSREPAQLYVFDPTRILAVLTDPDWVFHPLYTIRLADTSVRDTGHELFHTITASGLSCASCHPEARDDGRVRTFLDLGPRRTQNLRGGMLDTLPLHWGGEFADFDQLVADVWNQRMRGGPLSDAQRAALGQWIQWQPALKLKAADAAASARGGRLFESLSWTAPHATPGSP